MVLDPLLYLGEDEVARLCRDVDLLTIVASALRYTEQHPTSLPAETALRWTASDGTPARSLVLPARYGDTPGCKIINACIGNVARDMPRAHGLILLFDPATAAPVCIMEGGAISALRTAAVSAVAIRALHRTDAVGTITFLGCGRQADNHLRLLADLCPNLQGVLAVDIESQRAERFATRHRGTLPVKVGSEPETAVREGDLVIAATTATTAYVELDWLRPGSTFLNISLDDATEQLLLGCDHLIVDDWGLVRADQHRLLGRLARTGRVVGPDEAADDGARRVDAQLATLLAGRYPREIRSLDRVVVNPFGMGVHDVAIAAHVHQAALTSGIGTALPR